ncbi:MAG: hypothetical protein ACKV19_17400 [Verrucomicrobiales bacterium]
MKTPLTTGLALGLAGAATCFSFAGEPGVCDRAVGDYVLHEWGTFTTVAASDGSLLPGVEREEEPLPDFVYSHEAMHNHPSIRSLFTKGIDWRRPLANVTVRMETPVIYFYTEKPFDARVEVGFQGGTISQWYPQRSGGEKLPALKRDGEGTLLERENAIDFAKGYQGSIVWDVKVEPAGDDVFGRVFRGGETPSWLHPRQPDSALVTTPDGEAEKYLFYRGLGRLDPPVSFRATNDVLHVANASPESVRHWLIFDLNDAREARWQLPPPIVPAGEIAQPVPPVPLAAHAYRKDWRKPLYEDAARMLTDAGLTRAEADGMLQTWWRSYFEKSGLRVFWVVPSAYVKQVLPLTVTPAPKESVRVIVGRTELMTPAFEERLVADFEATTEEKPNPWTYDRYFLAYDARVKQLSGQTAAR